VLRVYWIDTENLHSRAFATAPYSQLDAHAAWRTLAEHCAHAQEHERDRSEDGFHRLERSAQGRPDE